MHTPLGPHVEVPVCWQSAAFPQSCACVWSHAVTQAGAPVPASPFQVWQHDIGSPHIEAPHWTLAAPISPPAAPLEPDDPVAPASPTVVLVAELLAVLVLPVGDPLVAVLLLPLTDPVAPVLLPLTEPVLPGLPFPVTAPLPVDPFVAVPDESMVLDPPAPLFEVPHAAAPTSPTQGSTEISCRMVAMKVPRILSCTQHAPSSMLKTHGHALAPCFSCAFEEAYREVPHFIRAKFQRPCRNGVQSIPVQGRTIRPGAPLAPSCVWHELQSAVVCGVVIATVFPLYEITAVNGMATDCDE